MAKRKLALVIAIGFFTMGNAQKTEGVNNGYDYNCCSLITSFNYEKTVYQFYSPEDLILGIDEIVKELYSNCPKKKKETCEISIEIKIEMSNGRSKTIISGMITTISNDDETNNTIQKLKAFLPETGK